MSILLSSGYRPDAETATTASSPSSSPTATAASIRTESRLFTNYGVSTPAVNPSSVLNAQAVPFIPSSSPIVELANATAELFTVNLPGNVVYRIGMKNGRYHGYGEVYQEGRFLHAGVWHERKGFLSEYPRRTNP